MKKNNLTKYILLTVGVVAALVLPFILKSIKGGKYVLNVVDYILVYGVATSGLNIMTGYSGQINLGGAAYFSVGAYASVILINLGISTLMALVLSMLIVAIFGLLTAIPAAKLKYHFLALATTAVGEIVNNFITVSPGGITNDTHGMFVSSLQIFGYTFKNDTQLYYLFLAFVVLWLLFTWAFINSRTGRACIATRDNLDAASSCGIDVKKYKIIATVTSCVIIGFAGFMFSYLNRYISPDTFAAGKSTMLMSMMMLGGSGTLFGPLLGTVLITLLTELLRDVPNVGNYTQLVYGLLLLVVMMFIPRGLNGLVEDIKFKRAKKQIAQGEQPC